MEILYEDNHIVAVNKRVSDIVQHDPSGDTPLDEKVKQYIREKYHKPGDVFLGIVHRIDRPVSGVVLFARTSKALERLNAMFKERSVKKIYWAIVKDAPPSSEGKLIHQLVRDTAKNKSFITTGNHPEAKTAELDYRVLGSSDRYHLLEINLHTGRHHQIRCQLAHIGCPIKGDLKYGYPRSNEDKGICLHSRYVEFFHPVKKEKLVITARPPHNTLWDYFIETRGLKPESTPLRHESQE